MKSTGIIRKVDELGRIVIPIELRRSLEISVHDELEIYTEDSVIVLKKYESSCVFCGKKSDGADFRNKTICHTCIAELTQ